MDIDIPQLLVRIGVDDKDSLVRREAETVRKQQLEVLLSRVLHSPARLTAPVSTEAHLLHCIVFIHDGDCTPTTAGVTSFKSKVSSHGAKAGEPSKLHRHGPRPCVSSLCPHKDRKEGQKHI